MQTLTLSTPRRNVHPPLCNITSSITIIKHYKNNKRGNLWWWMMSLISQGGGGGGGVFPRRWAVPTGWWMWGGGVAQLAGQSGKWTGHEICRDGGGSARLGSACQPRTDAPVVRDQHDTAVGKVSGWRTSIARRNCPNSFLSPVRPGKFVTGRSSKCFGFFQTFCSAIHYERICKNINTTTRSRAWPYLYRTKGRKEGNKQRADGMEVKQQGRRESEAALQIMINQGASGDVPRAPEIYNRALTKRLLLSTDHLLTVDSFRISSSAKRQCQQEIKIISHRRAVMYLVLECLSLLPPKVPNSNYMQSRKSS